MTPLLLLPGMMCDHRLFAPQVAALGRNRQIGVPDFGVGETMDAIAAAIGCRPEAIAEVLLGDDEIQPGETIEEWGIEAPSCAFPIEQTSN